MTLGKWFRKFIGKEQKEATEDVYALKTDTANTANILARARDSAQLEKVTSAVQQIEQIWTNEDQKNIMNVMLMIEETYTHLEKMADLEPLSADWLAEWTKAMEITNEKAAEMLKERGEE